MQFVWASIRPRRSPAGLVDSVSNLHRSSDFRACFVLHRIPRANAGASKLRNDVDLARRLYKFLESDVGQDTVKARCDRKKHLVTTPLHGITQTQGFTNAKENPLKKTK